MNKTTRQTETAKTQQHLRDRYRGEALTGLANLAAEVQELIANQASPATIVARVQMLAEMAGLTPIGQADHTTTFDPTIHETYAGTLPAGAPVTVIRPGYRLGDVVVCRATVIDL